MRVWDTIARNITVMLVIWLVIAVVQAVTCAITREHVMWLN